QVRGERRAWRQVQRLQHVLTGSLEVPACEPDVRDTTVRHHRKRIEFDGAFDVAQRLVEAPQGAGGHTPDVARHHVAGLQLDRTFQVPLTASVVEAVLPDGPALRRMRVGEVRRQYQRALGALEREGSEFYLSDGS